MAAKKYILPSAFVVAIWLLSYPILFHKLGEWPILKWDEARNAVNTLEMRENGAFYVRYFDGAVDAWETKPHLLIWLQLFSTRLFGVSEWALRLPSALSVLTVIGLLVAFFTRFMGRFWAACFGLLFILTCDGLIKVHVSSTADHDALLCLWLFGGSLAFFISTETSRKGFILLCGLATLAAVLTKSVVGLLLIPSWLIYVILTGQFTRLWRQKTHWWTILGVVACVGLYYAYVNAQVPGQWSHVLEMELWSRYQNKTGQYIKPELWRMTLGVFKHPSYIGGLLASIAATLYWGNARDKRFLLFCILNVGVFITILSFGVQYDWYDAPVYPFLAASIGVGFGFFADKIRSASHWSVVLAVLVAIFAYDYVQTSRRIDTHFKEDKPNELFGNALRYLQKYHPNERRVGMIFGDFDAYYAPMLFYEKWYARQGFDITLQYLPATDSPENSPRTPKLIERRLNVAAVEPNRAYITTHPPVLDSLGKKFELIFLEHNAPFVIFKIGALRQ